MTLTADSFEDWLVNELDGLIAEVDVGVSTGSVRRFPERRRLAAVAAVALAVAGLGAVWTQGRSASDVAMIDSVSSTALSSEHATRQPIAEIDPEVLVSVRGIQVHEDVAGPLDALLAAAEADGIMLSGSGHRSIQSQVDLRIENCGPTDYDIWEKAPALCSPPTAIPGTSTHNRGRAVDFTSDGTLTPDQASVVTKDSAGFGWLEVHAPDFGFTNRPSEPWHWEYADGPTD